jgi:hypothetical protein
MFYKDDQEIEIKLVKMSGTFQGLFSCKHQNHKIIYTTPILDTIYLVMNSSYPSPPKVVEAMAGMVLTIQSSTVAPF